MTSTDTTQEKWSQEENNIMKAAVVIAVIVGGLVHLLTQADIGGYLGLLFLMSLYPTIAYATASMSEMQIIEQGYLVGLVAVAQTLLYGFIIAGGNMMGKLKKTIVTLIIINILSLVILFVAFM